MAFRVTTLVLVLGTLLAATGLSDGAKVVQVSAGPTYSMALFDDGTIRSWGDWYQFNGQTVPPKDLTNVKYICGGNTYAAGIFANRTAFYFGWGDRLITSFPGVRGPVSAVSCGFRHAAVLIDETNIYVQDFADSQLQPGFLKVEPSFAVVAARSGFSDGVLAITKANGAIVVLDTNRNLQNLTPPAGLRDVAQLSADGLAAALLKDGTVRIWGTTDAKTYQPPAALQGKCKDIAVNPYFILARDADGKIYEWGDIWYRNISSIPFPSNITGKVTAIDVGMNHGIALMADGKILSWGSMTQGNQAQVPADLAYVEPAPSKTTSSAPPTTAGPTAAGPTSKVAQTTVPSDGSGSTPVGAIAGGVVGGIAALALLLAGFLVYRRKKTPSENPESPELVENKAVAPAIHPYCHQPAPPAEAVDEQKAAAPAPPNEPEPPQPPPENEIPVAAISNEPEPEEQKHEEQKPEEQKPEEHNPEEQKPEEVPEHQVLVDGATCVVLHPYEAEFEDELSLVVGEKVQIVHARQGGFTRWLYCEAGFANSDSIRWMGQSRLGERTRGHGSTKHLQGFSLIIKYVDLYLFM